MHPSQPTSTGIARFVPGLALIKGFSPALLRTEFVVAITVVAVLVPSAMAFGDLAGRGAGNTGHPASVERGVDGQGGGGALFPPASEKELRNAHGHLHDPDQASREGRLVAHTGLEPVLPA